MKRRDLLKAMWAGIFISLVPQYLRAHPDEFKDKSGTATAESMNVHLSRNSMLSVFFESERIDFTGEEIWEIFKSK